MKNLFVFGSEDYSFDNQAIKLTAYLAKQLPGWKIERMIRPEQLLQFIGTDFMMLDVAKGIEKPVIITDLDDLGYAAAVTAHDVDLASFLKILKELGQVGKVKIIAIPNDRDSDSFKDEIVRLIKECA